MSACGLEKMIASFNSVGSLGDERFYLVECIPDYTNMFYSGDKYIMVQSIKRGCHQDKQGCHLISMLVLFRGDRGVADYYY